MQLGVAGLLVVIIAAPVSAQEPDWAREFGERVGRMAAAIADTVVAEVSAAIEEAEQQRGRPQSGRDRGEDVLTEEFSQSHNIGRNGRVRVETLVGNISITGGAGETVQIRAVKRVRNTSEAEARRIMPGITIGVIARGNSVNVETSYRGRGNWQGQVDYTITVPSSTQLVLESRSGNIRVSGVDGDVRAETFSGNVNGTNLTRARQLKSFSGNVTIADSQGEEFSAESYSGNTTLQNVKAMMVRLSGVSGNVRVTDLEASRASLETLSGSIEYHGRFARGGRYEMKSHSGSIRVVPVDAVPFQLEANTFSGSVRSDYPVLLQSFGQGRRSNFTGPPQAEAAPSGDSAMLSLRSFSGSILITRK